MKKYLSKSFQYINDSSPNKGAVEWMNQNPQLIIIAIVSNDRFSEGCTVIYMNPEYKLPNF